MVEFVKAVDSSDLIKRRGIVRKLENDEIAVVMLVGFISAFVNICPHQHTPLVDK